MRGTERSERELDQHLGRNVFGWGATGAVAGLLVGILVGVVFSTPGRFGFWMAVVGLTIFFGAVAAFTAGIGSLEVPPPGQEPPDTPPAER